MSTNISTHPDIQIPLETQNLLEQVLDRKLRERDEYYLRQIQAHEEEAEARRLQREQEFQAEIAAHKATLESLSRQLEESRVDQL
jgi:ABC-type Fe3+-citrate transport system substrate-binding protein